jgi:hypothetical protein
MWNLSRERESRGDRDRDFGFFFSKTLEEASLVYHRISHILEKLYHNNPGKHYNKWDQINTLPKFKSRSC